jgi:putative spermidine/putrescine transport system permease protein
MSGLRLPTYATRSQRIGFGLFLTFCVLSFAFLMLPILAIIPISFSSSTYIYYPLPGLSTKWYDEFMQSEKWQMAIVNSLVYALMSSTIAMALGTMAALGLSRPQMPFRGLIFAVLLSPLIVPVVITALGIYFAWVKVGLYGTGIGVALAHAVITTPFVVITVSATLEHFDWTLVHAANSLGASFWRAFWLVVLPIIMPGVLSGGLIAFAMSLDEIIITIFIGTLDQWTIPREMFSGIRENISPVIAAAATVLIVGAVLILTAAELLRARGERLRTSKASQ